MKPVLDLLGADLEGVGGVRSVVEGFRLASDEEEPFRVAGPVLLNGVDDVGFDN